MQATGQTTLFLLSGLALIVAGCASRQDDIQAAHTAVETPSQQPPQDALDRGIAAQGGLAAWQSFGALEYDIDRGDRQEHHLIDLKTRKTLQTGKTYQFGYDGTDVWVAPGLDAFPGSARFSNGLDFYFFAIPFVLADPGTHREPLERVSVDGEEYDAVKITFDPGVGDSPDDYYIAHFDPETARLRVLLYTVTYSAQEPSDSYNARVYEEWQEVGGLVLPKKVASYSWDGEQRRLGERRRETVYSNIQLRAEQPAAESFERPEDAEIDAPITNSSHDN